MTNDYKERVIKWLTNNYEVEQSSTTPLFQTLNSTTTTINDYVDAVQGYIQGRDGKGNPLDIGFIYGEKNNKGVILVVNNNFDIFSLPKYLFSDSIRLPPCKIKTTLIVEVHKLIVNY